jgi:DNA processing protein
MKVNKLTVKSPMFPARLRDIPLPPSTLYILGELSPLLQQPAVALVGSRKVSPYGRQVTLRLARDLAAAGCVIVSGLALGVDALAHQAALDAGGKTIAVLPCGLESVYPASHFHLAKEILAKGGALLSEYPEGTPPLKVNFVARNRLVSGLSDGVLITEAAERSGTLHTANFALEQGKTVMAVPGNITSELSRGTNRLLKSGAAVITDANDVLDVLGLDKRQVGLELFGSNEAETLILGLLQRGITDGSTLLLQSRLETAEFNRSLTMLELSGKIRPLGGGHWGLN